MLSFLLSISDESNASKVMYIYNNFHSDMMRFAMYKLYFFKSRNIVKDAEDVVQNSFLKILKYIDDIDFSRPKKDIKLYVFSIVVNEVLNMYEKADPVISLDETLEIESKENEKSLIEYLDIKENYKKVVDAIAKLDVKYSTILFLVYCQDFSVRDVSKILKIPPKTIYTRLERGKTKIFQLLGMKGNDDGK